MVVCVVCTLILGVRSNIGVADDWPTYRFNSARGGATAETVGPQLYLHGKFMPAAAPKPAWPAPSEEMPRSHSDNAFHVAVANGSAYFGSSVTNKVYSVDVTTGTVDWTFFAEGPVRFAPTVADGRIYFGSDDGYVYCVNAYDGSLVWKYRAGPSDEKIVGNGRIISIWPVRTSVLVDDGQVFFGAGVFPFEGIYICALDAKDGSVIWKNDTIGDRPHDLEWGGISPQGYVIVSDDALYVPSGRSMPAAFDRKSGRLLFYASPGGKRGGTWAMLDAANSELIAGVDSSGTPNKYTYEARTGARRGYAFGWFLGIDLVLTQRFAYVLNRNGIYGIDRAEYYDAVKKVTRSQVKRKDLGKELDELKKKLQDADKETGKKLNEQINAITRTVSDLSAEERQLKESSFKWRYGRKDLCSLIMAGEILYAGGEGLLVGINAKTGKEVWKTDVSGKAIGLAASDGRLLVSTDKGPIYCFGEEYISEPIDIRPPLDSPSFPNDQNGKIYASAVEKIIKDSSVNKGYCLVVDCGVGQLAYDLAMKTDMKIIGIEKDPKKLRIARSRFEAAGLLGSRVVVEPWDVKDLPPYFANLIVSDGLLISGQTDVGRGGLKRVLRPCGGVMIMGRATDKGNLRWRKFVRGKLEGAAGWTQLYANPQNTACSADELVKGPFGLLWYGEPGPQQMVERHARAESPVSINGRLFVQGEEVVMAYDAYNGSFLWERKIPGAVRTRVDVDGGNLALTEDALYIAAYEQCLRLDPATGKTVRKYKLPDSTDGSPRRWGYVTCVGNVLLGTAAKPLQQQYAAIWNDFIEGDRWKEPSQISPEVRQRWGGEKDYMERYESLKSTYPVPDENLRRSLQRSGAFWHPLTNFPSWSSQRSPRGSLTSRLMGGDTLFATDVNTGKHLWVYRGKRIPNITVCTTGAELFFVESEPSEDQRAAALEEKRRLVEQGLYEQGDEAKLKLAEADVRIVVALEVATGKVLWKKPLELTGCGGDKMGTAWADGVLLFFGHFSNHDTGFFKKNELTWRRITAINAKTGEVLWSRPLNYLRRPLVIGGKIIVEPRACELRTGKLVTRKHPITGNDVTWEFLRPGHCCSVTSASASTLFYRSYWAAMYDFADDKGLSLFGAIRPGCWLNMIAANGLMLMPEASSGCTCSFPLRCSVALVNKPKKVTGNWTVFVTHGATTPVKHLAVNFGAPGDMKADDGTIWFGYPRPKTVSNIGYGSYEIKLDLKDKAIEGMGPFCRDYRGVRIRGTDRPWLFTSGYLGLIRCELPLIDDGAGQGPASYTVRVGFKPLANDKPGQRVFDVKLQDEVMLSKFDISKTSSKPNTAVVKEFKGVEVRNSLILELLPKLTDPKADQAPAVNFIEVIREEH